jgi:hypothetical protein
MGRRRAKGLAKRVSLRNVLSVNGFVNATRSHTPRRSAVVRATELHRVGRPRLSGVTEHGAHLARVMATGHAHRGGLGRVGRRHRNGVGVRRVFPFDWTRKTNRLSA